MNGSGVIASSLSACPAKNALFLWFWEFGAYLQQSSSQIKHHKGEGQRCVASLQQVDGVEEHEVPWDNQEEQDSGWLGIHLCRGQTETVIAAAADGGERTEHGCLM